MKDKICNYQFGERYTVTNCFQRGLDPLLR